MGLMYLQTHYNKKKGGELDTEEVFMNIYV